MGPLQGIRVVEIAGIGPGQLCGMLLADMGADLIRIERLSEEDSGLGIAPRYNLMNRGRPSIGVDLKRAEGVALVLGLCQSADAMFEGFRPGVMERLGLGPGECMAANAKLVYGRVTGWGQHGPLAGAVGHDANYLALTGALAAIGRNDDAPVLPLNLVADFGGGALYLALGMLAALLEAGRSGQGQVVDAAMVDGVASMMTLFHGLQAAGLWSERRAANLLDGGAPFYRTYATRDDRAVAVAAIEPRFFRTLLRELEIDDIDPESQFDAGQWPAQAARIAAVFAGRTRAQWQQLLEGSDACVTPVLTMSEAADHPHNRARSLHIDVAGIRQPAPAPRFSRTAGGVRQPAGGAPPAADDLLSAWGIDSSQTAALRAAGILS
jgi:alpha-methylacyl-CoA racemase